MSAAALRKIQAELEQLATDAAEAPVDAFDLRIIARKIGAQAEMIEIGVASDG